MKTTLETCRTIEEICEGFVYNELDPRGVFGMNGQLVIQPEYQRNYIYDKDKKDVAVIDSVLKGYPLGLIYFNRRDDKLLEILDGQQRITSLGRFLTDKFAVKIGGNEQYFHSLPPNLRNKILKTPLLIYVCEGTESEIKEWFKTINIAGVPLNDQEFRNAVYSGEFVTKARKVFSNSKNPYQQKWAHFVKGSVNRQDILQLALKWISSKKGCDIDQYMAAHRNDTVITEMEDYFNAVINWAAGLFTVNHKEMQSQDWAGLYETYYNKPYNITALNQEVSKLFADFRVTEKRGIYKYLLEKFSSGHELPQLLKIRIFGQATKSTVYAQQTNAAKAKGESNCPLCAAGSGPNSTRIWNFDEMDADHVTPWSKGGATNISNCQMLCQTHNRAKGNI